MTVMEQVIKGKISIIKHTDNGDTKIETPEKGAEFQVYLKSAGSFVNADKDELLFVTKTALQVQNYFRMEYIQFIKPKAGQDENLSPISMSSSIKTARLTNSLSTTRILNRISR